MLYHPAELPIPHRIDEDPVTALRPLFAAAGVLLLIALVALAVRSSDDTPVPSAGGTVAPGETSTEDTGDPTDDATTGLPSPTASPDDTATFDDGATSGDSDDTGTDTTGTEDLGTDDSGTDDSGTDDSGTDDSGTEADSSGSPGSDDGSTGSDSSTGSGGSGSEDTGSDSETDGDDREVVAIGETGSDVDDMPDTGGGVAGVLGGLVAIGAAGIARRR